MAYIALYRKYRSQSFDELMGQEQVTVTLQNAIRSGRIAHAYLFYGARGCGKTSTARLLARALNCVAQDGPTPEPCGTCRLCVSIRDGNCMDVIEMDAASETGIDDVREKIIENVQYAPGEARYKVYIIDEVHDLSAKAFDALLKTLEEPPPHVIFILATTEQHKVPITIRSRCQPFHFKRGTLHDLAASVERVVTQEGFTAEPEAIQAIARSAEGSWRDALSILEQVLAYSDGHVTAETVHRAVGSVGTETLARVTETLARGEWNTTLAIAGELIDSGKDVRQLLTALSGHLRDLMLLAAGAKEAAAQELGADRLAMLLPQAALFDPPTLLTMTGVLSNAEREIRFTNQHRWLLERTLLALMPCNQTMGLREQAADNPAQFRAQPAMTRQQSPLSATPTIIPRPLQRAQADDVEATSPDLEPEASVLEGSAFTNHVDPSAPLLPPVKPPVVPSVLPDREAAPRSNPPESAPPPPAASQEHRFADAISLDVVKRAWPRVLALFRKVSPQGAIWLEQAEVTGLEGNTVVLSFLDSFARDRIQNNDKGKTKFEQTLNQALHTEGYKIRCILRDLEGGNGGADGGSPVPSSTGPKSRPTAGASVSPPSEMATLLDAPPTPPSAPTRIADFDMPSAAPTSSYSGNGVQEAPPAPVMASPKTPEPNPAPEPPANTGFLAETLDIFGGEVVRSDPL